MKLTYGVMLGSETLRNNIVALYKDPKLQAENVLTTNGGIGANHIVLQALLSPGDHIICVSPTFEQLYQTPTMFGIDVTLWKHDQKNNWQLDPSFLLEAIKPNTKMIIVNNPNQPTGSYISKHRQNDIVSIAKKHNLILLSDEVFRPAFLLEASEIPLSFIDFDYSNIIVTSSLSKAYGLAGTRTGWIASRSAEILEKCTAMRFYTNISVSRVDEAIAAEALNDRVRIPLLSRNREILEKNVLLMQSFVDDHEECEWIRPNAATTGLLRFSRDGHPVNDRELCLQLLDKTGVLLVPASLCYGDFHGYVRVGCAIDNKEFEGGLTAMREFMKTHFVCVPLAQE